MLRRALVVALAITLAASACASGEARRELMPPVAVNESRAPHDVDKIVWADVSFSISGNDTLDIQNVRTKLKIVEILGDHVPQIAHFFSVSSAEHLELPNGAKFLYTADVAPSTYKGAPGRYTMSDKGVPPLEGTTMAIGSAAYVWFLYPLPKPLVKYDKFLEPCTLEVGTRAEHGSVTCPKLGSELEDGTWVSVQWSWWLV